MSDGLQCERSNNSKAEALDHRSLDTGVLRSTITPENMTIDLLLDHSFRIGVLEEKLEKAEQDIFRVISSSSQDRGCPIFEPKCPERIGKCAAVQARKRLHTAKRMETLMSGGRYVYQTKERGPIWRPSPIPSSQARPSPRSPPNTPLSTSSTPRASMPLSPPLMRVRPRNPQGSLFSGERPELGSPTRFLRNHPMFISRPTASGTMDMTDNETYASTITRDRSRSPISFGSWTDIPSPSRTREDPCSSTRHESI